MDDLRSDTLSHDVYHASFYHCAVGMAHVALDGRFIRVNSSLCHFLGYPAELLSTFTFQQLTADAHVHKDVAFAKELIAGKRDSYSMEKQYMHSSGRLVWGKLTVSLVRDLSGQPRYFISVVEDIDEKKRCESKLHDTETLFQQIVSSFSVRTFVWVADPELRKMIYMNDGYRLIWGGSRTELLNYPLKFLNYIHEEDKSRVSEIYRSKERVQWDLEYRILNDAGVMRYIHDRGMTVYSDNGKPLYVVGTADDVTDDKCMYYALLNANKKLELMSRTDGLTGILNRREMLYQVDQEIKRLRRDNLQSTLLFIDLNEFKAINDDYGHRTGDDALRRFCQVIGALLRESDCFGRYGGDEFLVLLHDAGDTAAKLFEERLLNAGVSVTGGDNVDVPVKFSVGQSVWTPAIQSAQQWVELADSSMYRQKRQLRHQNHMQQ
ncbi:diguanylate cyclase [Alteromonas sp. CYL-A6]|uniref:diguanylate cyclase n=1 Tax=Alteromonas nitratireducens TaxID=3390813 RepID=UPI0034B57562